MRPGDVVRVKVLAVDVSRNRIGLSVRRAEGAPLSDPRSKAAKRPPDRGKPAGGGVTDALRRASHDKGR